VWQSRGRLSRLTSEPRYVALSDKHPLARRASVTFAEIEAEPWIEVSESDPVWCAGETSPPVSEFITVARELAAPAR
jgi:DNA-binding transcriptional LysR family regulator